ncbi:VWA domain-containing protein [Solirubrobacter ginsenosidimutans]|uniref:VWA domain-containing protein n=1 Tax=Solirubrobacter ginsenosidimutans TaxID=490573 RepID=A0A9X3S6B8_9ACTN|nr:hypothetical protein [Solirubrobacter ginsenosidimutans]MDA0166547.1 VWA domain-containing protein [Solirubrobacter ginsenosidimutans]
MGQDDPPPDSTRTGEAAIVWLAIFLGSKVVRAVFRMARAVYRAIPADDRPPPPVVGLLIDVSASMRESFTNEAVGETSRFESALAALGDFARRGGTMVTSRLEGQGNAVRVFAYAFGVRGTSDGVCDLLSLMTLLRGRPEPEESGEGEDDDAPVMSDPYEYLRAVAEHEQRGGWAAWIDTNVDRRSAANLAANLHSHPALSSMLRDVLPDLSSADIEVLLSAERARAARGVRNVRGRYRATREIGGSDAVAAARQVHRAGGRDALRQKVVVANRMVTTLSHHVLDESELRAALDDPELRELIQASLRARLDEAGDTTLTVDQLAELLRSPAVGDARGLNDLLYGTTPMCAALEKAERRFARLRGAEDAVLVIVSDGDPTDGEPLATVERIRAHGVLVMSCFVTRKDLLAPRSLATHPGEDWDRAARLMFECASPADDAPQTRFLLDHGWSAPPGARFFAQLNHSAVLSEFLRSARG